MIWSGVSGFLVTLDTRPIPAPQSGLAVLPTSELLTNLEQCSYKPEDLFPTKWRSIEIIQ